MLDVAFRGSVRALRTDAMRADAFFSRSAVVDDAVRERTAAIIARVRAGGDDALRAMSAEFDGVAVATAADLEVPRAKWLRALNALAPTTRTALERAVENIRAVHEAFRPLAQEFVTRDGAVIGRRPDPLARVGVYAPGGRAAYPSSLLMGAVPARVAGVREVIVCSPPLRDQGVPADIVLAAAAVANVDRVFAIGGAGAIAALAFGTSTVPAVDRIVGPGNAFVAAAKAQIAGRVGIDAPAGPSELMVLADAGASPLIVARELIAQSEHDPEAAVVCVLIDDGNTAPSADEWLTALEMAMRAELMALPRASIVRASLAARGAMLVAASLDEAIEVATDWAPEHLLLALEPTRCDRAQREVRNAGTILIGESASVAFGDYLSGANHVLPTAGLARAWSGLSTQDFVRWTTWQRIDRASAAQLAVDTAVLAEAEGLRGHAVTARQWATR
jgi:histidinol dehydrogenase